MPFAIIILLTAVLVPNNTRAQEIAPGTSDVRFAFELTDYRLFFRNTAGPATEVCSLPCTAQLRPGLYRLSIGQTREHLAHLSEILRLDGPARVDLSLQSSEGERIAGWLLVIGTGLLGVGAWVIQGATGGHDSGWGWVVAGTFAAAGGLGIGLNLALTDDRVLAVVHYQSAR